MDRRLRLGRLAIYIEPRDIWVGAYVAGNAIYVCPLPLVVLRWTRLRPTTPHQITDACVGYHCHIHDVDEPWARDSYKYCFECKHVYQTADELLSAHHEHYVGVPARDLPRFDPAELVSCPHCAHDF